MDFIIGLSMSNSFNTVLVVVDRLSKIAYYIPTTTKCNSEILVKLFLDNIFCLHGLPDSIITNRGTQFTSKFARFLYNLLRIQ